jgi:xanthine dehydrogenase accessory factor
MPEWLQALRLLCNNGTPSILITVADAQGSTPRAAGARMVVSSDRQFDTIGGGHLEWRVIEIAQTLLREQALAQQPLAAAAATASATAPYTPSLRRFPLGPSLGQCCGGTVRLLFEKIDTGPGAAAMIAALVCAWEEGRDVWRRLPLAPGASAQLMTHGPNTGGDALTHPHAQTHIGQDGAGRPVFFDFVCSERPQVFLFGAGHVGTALATLLSALPCRLTWIDERTELFPAILPPNVAVEVSEHPEDFVRDAPAAAYYLVMTHSHAIDQILSERILRRGDAAWFGLIGSATKRALFLKRLTMRGLTTDQMAGMTCPIGIAGIVSKEPANIAIAVAAQLLQLWEQAARIRATG